MLVLRIAVRDLGSDWKLRNGRWIAGSSAVEPYLHPSLESYTITADGCRAFVVRERLGGRDVEGSRQDCCVSTEAFERVVAETLRWPLNLLVVRIVPSSPVPVEICSGGWGTAPLFLIERGEILYGHWDVARLYGLTTQPVDFTRAAYILARIGTPYSRHTLFPEILMLTERARALWKGTEGSLSVEYPPALPRHLARELANDDDKVVVDAFERLLSASLCRWAGTTNHSIAADLSGGLDSSTATAVLARCHPGREIRTYGLRMPGNESWEQSLRRAEVVRHFGTIDTELRSELYPPFSAGERGLDDAAVQWGEYYHEAFRALLDRVTADGCTSIVRGLGGDEISTLEANECGTDMNSAVEAVPSFLTPRAAEAFYAAGGHLDPTPSGAAARSFYESASAGSTLYLRAGVWPIYPYGTPEVVTFCRSLPVYWRRERTLQRKYLAHCGLSRRVTHPDPPESFLPLRDLAMRDQSKVFVNQLFQNSRLADLGLVDTTALLRSYEKYCDDPSWWESDSLFEAASFELTLRAMERARSLASRVSD